MGSGGLPFSTVISIDEELRKCFKCGMCRAVCPVLAEEHIETSGPRAKVALCEALKQGTIQVTETALDILRRCTGCRACSLNCKARTDTRGLVAAVGSEIRRRPEKGPKASSPLGRFLLDILVEPDKDLSAYGGRKDPEKSEVAYFIGCAEARLLKRVPENTLRILEKLGVSVAVPDQQTCCGWPQVLTGDLATARKLALLNQRAFSSFTVVLTSCVHCQSMLTHDYPTLLGVEDIAPRTKNVLEFVKERGRLRLPAMEGRTEAFLYNRACRTGRGRNRSESAAQLLRDRLNRSFTGEQDDGCCGAPLELYFPGVASSMLDRKKEKIARSGCSLVLAECPFCFLAMESSGAASVKHLLAEIDV